MTPRASARLTVLAQICIAAASAHAQWSFSLVADSSTPIPNGTGNFTNFASPSISGGRVAFAANSINSTLTGVYTNMTGPLTRVADRSVPIPGYPGTFAAFGPHVSMDGSSVSFAGGRVVGGTTEQGGIYSSFPGNPLATIVDTAALLPPASTTFSTPGVPQSPFTHHDQSAAFLTGDPAHPGGAAVALYGWTGGTYHHLLDTSTHMPGGTGNFMSMNYMSMGGTTVAVSARDTANLPGVYTIDASGGSVSTIIDPTTPAPNGSGTFFGIGVVSSSGSNLCFGGTTLTQRGMYALINGSLITIADRNTPAPDGGLFTDIESGVPYAISGSNIVFEADSQAHGRGIYVWRSGVLSRVISEGDTLNGHFIDSLGLSTEGIDGDTIAFSVAFGPGPETYAVYTATIPSPAAPALFAAAALLASRRRRSPT